MSAGGKLSFPPALFNQITVIHAKNLALLENTLCLFSILQGERQSSTPNGIRELCFSLTMEILSKTHPTFSRHTPISCSVATNNNFNK